MKRDTTNPTVATIVSLRVAGALSVVVMAAMPTVAIFLAFQYPALRPFAFSLILWAAAFGIIYVALGRTRDALRMLTLITACCFVWTFVIGIAATPFFIRIAGADSLPPFGQIAALSGATFGFVCYLRYRGLPPREPGALRLSTMSVMPGLTLLIVWFASQLTRAHPNIVREVGASFFCIVVFPFALALIISETSIQLTRRGITEPGHIS